MCSDGNTIRNAPPTRPDATQATTSHEVEGERRTDAASLQPDATPRRSLFKLQLRNAIARLAFFKPAPDITRNLERGTSAYHGANLLQNLSRHSASADRICKALTATLIGRVKDRPAEVPPPAMQAQLESQVTRLSDSQLYRLHKRVSSPKMGEISEGLRLQAEETDDPDARKLLRTAAERIETTARIVYGELERRGYRVPDTVPPTPRQAALPPKELRLFTQAIQDLARGTSSRYTLTPSSSCMEELRTSYGNVADVAEELDAGTLSRERAKSKGVLDEELPPPSSTPDDIGVCSLFCKDFKRSMQKNLFFVNPEGVSQQLVTDEELKGLLPSIDADRINAIGAAKLKQQFGDNPRLLYKLSYVLTQNSGNFFSSAVTFPQNYSREQHHTLPAVIAKQSKHFGTDYFDVLTGGGSKFTLSQDKDNVIVDVEYRHKPSQVSAGIGQQPYDMLDADASSAIGTMRVLVPKNGGPARVDGDVKLDVFLRAVEQD